MLLGTLIVDHEQGAIHTGRDSYLLDTLTAVSVRRPLLPFCLAAAIALAAFGIAFGDLLYAGEVAVLAAVTLAQLAAGFSLARLSLISRDLRGAVFADAIWGRAATLNRLRAEIVAAIVTTRRMS